MTVFPDKTEAGGVLLVMLVILVVGIVGLFVISLASTSFQNSRRELSSEALARAREALIGYAIRDDNLPGSLPCPDTNDDGVAELFAGNDCPSYLGRLPWKTLKISDLRDGAGERLWYALSAAYRPQTPTPHAINSETSGTLSLTGTLSANTLAAIVFAPGQALSAQSRGGANQNTSGSYLEGIISPGSFQAATPNDHRGGAYTYNDQILTLSTDDVLIPVEMRIAREARQCLESYANSHGNRFPWPAHPQQPAYPYSESGITFGRLPKHDAPTGLILDFVNALSDFQLKVAACANGTGNQAALETSGNTLKNAAKNLKNGQPTTPAMGTGITSPAKSAGDKAKSRDVTCAEIQADPTGNDIQKKLDQTLQAMDQIPASLSWNAACLINQPYWKYWQNQVFYQIDNAYSPTGSLTGTGNITVNGQGNYRAVVIVARKPINGQTRNPTDSASYLESPNNHTPTAPASAFMTENPLSNASRNDLVLCLDGGVSCQ